MLKRLFILSIVFIVSHVLSAQVVVEERLDSADILIGEQVRLHTKVVAPRGAQVVYPPLDEQSQLVQGVEIVEVGKVDTAISPDGARSTFTRSYVLTSFDSALYSIPPFEVKVGGKAYASPHYLGLKVSTVPVDTVHVENFAGPHGVVPAIFQWSPRLFLCGVLLFALTVLLVGLLVRLTDRRPIVKRVVLPPRMLPHQLAISSIEEIKKRTPEDERGSKDYFVQLTDVLRQYIHDRFEIDAREKTSSEIIEALTGLGDATALSELRDVLETADLVKFAKYEASMQERDRSVWQAMSYVNETKQEPAEKPKPIVQEITLDAKRQNRRRRLQEALAALTFVAIVVLAAYLGEEIYNNFL